MALLILTVHPRTMKSVKILAPSSPFSAATSASRTPGAPRRPPGLRLPPLSSDSPFLGLPAPPAMRGTQPWGASRRQIRSTPTLYRSTRRRPRLRRESSESLVAAARALLTPPLQYPSHLADGVAATSVSKLPTGPCGAQLRCWLALRWLPSRAGR